MSIDMGFGVVQFDDMRPDGGGWASADGGRARRIGGIGDLQSDVIWWTNIDDKTFFLSGCHSNLRLRHDEYLKTRMPHLLEELGIQEVSMSPAQSTQILSEIFCRVMKIAVEEFGVQLRNRTLADDLRAVLLPPDRRISENVDAAAKHCYQTWIQCEKNPSRRRSKMVRFRRQRYLHAMDILNNPIPSRQWDFMSKDDVKKLGNTPADVVDWFLNCDRPVMAEVSVKRIAPGVSPIVAFGSGSSGIHRTWVSGPELAMLARFGEMSIKTAFVAGESLPLEPRKPFLPAVGIDRVSISRGLVMEAYWIALSLPQPAERGEKIYSPTHAWLRAHDRNLLLESALKVFQEGLYVNHYGSGVVGVIVPSGSLREAMEICAKADLIAPLSAKTEMLVASELA